MEYYYDTSGRPFAEDPQRMRSSDILLARYQSSDRSIIPHSQQTNIMQLSVCEKKRLRFREIKDLGTEIRWNTAGKTVSECREMNKATIGKLGTDKRRNTTRKTVSECREMNKAIIGKLGTDKRRNTARKTVSECREMYKAIIRKLGTDKRRNTARITVSECREMNKAIIGKDIHRVSRMSRQRRCFIFERQG